MVTRRLKELNAEDIKKISSTYHDFCKNETIMDEVGFSRVISNDILEQNDYVLTPGRYVEFDLNDDEDISFEEKVDSLKQSLSQNIEESKKLDEEILNIFKILGENNHE